jgi:argininosuccinate synthase
VQRTIFAFNGDLESRLALHWLVHEQGYEVISLSINLGQDAPLHTLAETALDLGASAAQVVDGQDKFLRQFALPVLQANAVYQNCFLGSALARYLIAEELVNLAWEEGCTSVAHAAAGKGNDQAISSSRNRSPSPLPWTATCGGPASTATTSTIRGADHPPTPLS